METVNEFMFNVQGASSSLKKNKIWHESDTKPKKPQAIPCSETMNNLKGL